MKYNESDLDKSLRNWFSNDFSKTMLRQISLETGQLRSVSSFKVDINYPILAVAGKNGAGKSTLIAIACCAYHNAKNGYRPQKRNQPYYTFRDFFIQRPEEALATEDITIKYTFALDNFDKSKYPDGKALGYQLRKKSSGGKWNDYKRRLRKSTVFLGIERIVPHSERSQSKSYSRAFSDIKAAGWEESVKDIVGSILGKPYDEFKLLRHSKYSLPLVRIGSTVYSGFNMGAGENALFEIFSAIYESGGKSLIVIDEIELGLHAEAQRKFMHALKETCQKTHTQVICTTHSRDIFDCLPDDARVFIEQINGKTKTTQGISSDFAMAKLGARQDKELQIFVEDDIAQAVVTSTLNATTRTRVDVVRIGSAGALSRQLAAAYVRGEKKKLLAVFDGDQMALETKNINHAKSMAETKRSDFENWIKSRMCYLPSETWPESWLVQTAKEITPAVAAAVGAEEDELSMYLDYGLQAGKHREFSEIALRLGLSRDQAINAIVPLVCAAATQELEALRAKVVEALANG
ncbi:ATP-dependent nuclease [Pseudacidovorax intermedius]|uniref:ATP-dependent nuclease n=1 Tax=Pseudacidovorax intermedius TaxID=433924 RepID=UPI000347DC72|nr:AAA family ATPase [Pseudacidovorax intermedius]